MSRFHQAARDGYVDLLRQANRKECNLPDEDGVTPTLLAAACGNLEVLRVLVGRGGDPDKCDYYGNSALHWAAGNGHVNCVSFLVNFGVNLWTLDNTHHTAKDLAGIKGQKDILRYLDIEAAKQSSMNKKNVQNLKEKAVKEAEKRIKEYERLQKKTARKAEREDKKLKKETEKMYTNGQNGEVDPSTARPSISIPNLGIHRDSQVIYNQPKFSEIVNSGSGSKKPAKGGVAQKIQKKKDIDGDFKVRETDNAGNHSVRSLNGLRRDSEVLYVPKREIQNGGQNAGRQHVDTIFTEDGKEPYRVEPPSMFAIGGGSLVFRPSLTDTLLSIPPDFAENHRYRKDGDDYSDPGSPSRISEADSIGSAGSLVRANGTHRTWYNGNRGDVDTDDSALETFLVAHDLRTCLQCLQREKIDLKALLLLTENDLKEIQLPMGERKKMMEAIGRRKAALYNAGDVSDSRL